MAQVTDDEIVEYYRAGNSLRQTGRRFNVSHEWVRKVLLKNARGVLRSAVTPSIPGRKTRRC